MSMNKIILIGGNHHNGLGLVRSFGINGISPYGIVVNPSSKSCFVTKSKYWKHTFVINNNEQIIDTLLSNFSNEQEKPVIIPWSDSAAAEIDKNLNKLSQFFIVPSLNGKEGAIVKMMDKKNQIDFIQKYGLPMAKSWTVSLPYNDDGTNFIYPCICKPVSSYEGTKKDIKKCDTPQDLVSYLNILSKKDYKQFLVQEYISFDKELVFSGSCDSQPSYIISENVREWPVIGGTNSFFKVIDDSTIHNICQNILAALQKENYYGMFDIELFQVNEKVYLNEINWRNTGNSFFALGTQVHWAVIWYLQAIGKDTSYLKHTTKDITQCAMNESTDLRHVLFKGLPFSVWFKDLKRMQSFALWYKKDLRPTVSQYIYLIKELILHRRKG